uniref:Vint domain-containing protein n=1 Tax=viral metagenome TaxID=1070528 RepID=A0A6C0CPA0_9ZZZZ
MDNINIRNELFFEKMKKIYNKTSYWDLYGTSVLWMILIKVIFIVIFIYFYFKARMQPIRDDWVNMRCHPAVIPFAGFINSPKGTNIFKFTAMNFTFCVSNILGSIVEYFFTPIYKSLSIVLNSFEGIKDTIEGMRVMMRWLIDQVIMILDYILSMVMKLLAPIYMILMKFQDSMNKSVGLLTIIINVIIAGLYSLTSIVSIVMAICIAVLVTLSILAILFFVIWAIFPLNIPALTMGFSYVAIMVGLMIPVAIATVFVGQVLSVATKAMPPVPAPGKPKCFDEDTILETQRGLIPIKNIVIGDILKNNSIVEGIFKLSSSDQNMYNLDGVIVSGTHKVMYKNKMINVSQHPHAVYIENYRKPIIYCLNTSNKRIYLNDYEFFDWDEIEKSDLQKLNEFALIKEAKYELIHKYLDGGFHGDTEIELLDGQSVKIKDVNVNDVLRFGEIVKGIVIIDGTNVNHLKKYTLNKNTYICGPNININDNDLGKFSTYNLQGINHKKQKYLYHLITDKNSFIIDGVRFLDYNSCIEEILDNEILNYY